MITATYNQLAKLGIVVGSKRICIDLDGCIVEYDFPRIVKNFFGVNLSKHQIYAYDLADVLGVSPATIDTMFNGQVWGEPNFIHEALETLREWKERHEIVIFSNRVKYMGYDGLHRWLKEYEIPFNRIRMDEKEIYDVHIDDSPSKLMSTNSITKLLYSQPWNEGCLNIRKAIKRVKNWQEIKECVRE